MEKIEIIVIDNVIGIPGNECYVCGKTATNRHHVIPKTLKPLKNVTIPLCDEHKDCCHPIVKQFYFPKNLRVKLNRAKKHSLDTLQIINSMQDKLDFSKNTKQYTRVQLSSPTESKAKIKDLPSIQKCFEKW